ncbi:MAG: DMT family transporter [Saprospiraceae bacterium]|nr:DMT family transporter [Saprospiraceae bacterium]MBP6235114.1 DMT family transporter [Saprospiraceae bacterium]
MTILAATLWSTGGLFIKLLPLDAFTILFYRSFYAAVIFIIIFRKSLFRFNKLSLVSILFYAPLLIAFVTSTKLTTAANAIFLQYTAPAVVLLLEPYFVRTKLTKINIFTVAVCFAGMCLFFVEQFSRPDNWLGIWIAFFNGLILAGFLIIQKMNKPEFLPGAVFLGNIVVCLITLPWFIENPFPTFQENNYLMILGFGQLGLGFALFLFGQKYLPAIESSLISMLEPLLNPVWVFIGYGENPGYWAMVGGLVIIAALIFRLYWIEVREKQRYPT